MAGWGRTDWVGAGWAERGGAAGALRKSNGRGERATPSNERRLGWGSGDWSIFEHYNILEHKRKSFRTFFGERKRT